METRLNDGTKPFNRRLMMAGAAGLGMLAVAGGRLAGAQESTPAAEDASVPDDVSDRRAELETARLVYYTLFLENMSANLGVADLTAIDTAIRDSLKSLVDHAFDEGEISANLADERKAKIDEATVPIAVGAAGFMRGQGGRVHPDPRGNRPFGGMPDDEEPQAEEASASM